MKTPHIHSELIKQWADGEQIQYLSDKGWWLDAAGSPSWRESTTYRVKPEPKPDVVMYGNVDTNPVTHQPMLCRSGVHNVMFVFDGETKELKDVQLLAKE